MQRGAEERHKDKTGLKKINMPFTGSVLPNHHWYLVLQTRSVSRPLVLKSILGHENTVPILEHHFAEHDLSQDALQYVINLYMYSLAISLISDLSQQIFSLAHRSPSDRQSIGRSGRPRL